jgi:hypothetical protein
VRLDTIGPREATLTSPALAVTLNPARRLVAPGQLPHAAAVVGDLLGIVGIVFCIPFVILGVGIPIALGARLLLWIVGML